MKTSNRRLALIQLCFCIFIMTAKAQTVSIPGTKVFDEKTQTLSDLNYIGKAIGDSRIVILGEQDHGDATSMLAKSKLVKYLVEKKGFSVLLWEDDYFAFDQMSSNPGQYTVDSFKNIVSPYWSTSAVMQDLWGYLSENAQKPKPITMNGFGIAFRSSYAQRNLRLQLEALLKIKQLSLEKSEDRSWYLSIVDSLVLNNSNNFDEQTRQKFFSWCDRLQKELGGKSKSEISAEEQFIYNIKAKAEYTWLREYRVKHMAANAHWLLQNRYKNKKVIIWTANYHATRDYGKVVENHPTSGPMYKNAIDKDTVKSFTQLLLEKGQESIYSLACISLSGTYTPRAWIRVDNPVEKINIPSGNIESVLNQQTAQSLFVDLKTLPRDHILQSPWYMIPVAHTRSLISQWVYVFDGILFVKEQKGLQE
jgi:erythromycin esterase